MYVFRHSGATGPDFEKNFPLVMKKIMDSASYDENATVECCPDLVNDITLLQWIFQETLGEKICHNYIGNLPRQLETQWSIVEITETSPIQPGDVIFWSSTTKKISALAICAPENLALVTTKEGGAVLQSISALQAHYKQKLKPENTRRYIDPQDKSLKGLYNGQLFLPMK